VAHGADRVAHLVGGLIVRRVEGQHHLRAAFLGGRAHLVDAADRLQRLLDPPTIALDRLGRRAGVWHRDHQHRLLDIGIWLTRSRVSASRPRPISAMMITTVATGRLMLKSDRNMRASYWLAAAAHAGRGGPGEFDRCPSMRVVPGLRRIIAVGRPP
jgi:hypothetical protein